MPLRDRPRSGGLFADGTPRAPLRACTACHTPHQTKPTGSPCPVRVPVVFAEVRQIVGSICESRLRVALAGNPNGLSRAATGYIESTSHRQIEAHPGCLHQSMVLPTRANRKRLGGRRRAACFELG